MFENNFFYGGPSLLLKMVEEFLIQLEKYLYKRVCERERFVKTFYSK